MTLGFSARLSTPQDAARLAEAMIDRREQWCGVRYPEKGDPCVVWFSPATAATAGPPKRRRLPKRLEPLAAPLGILAGVTAVAIPMVLVVLGTFGGQRALLHTVLWVLGACIAVGFVYTVAAPSEQRKMQRRVDLLTAELTGAPQGR
jgi:hypothetical protein